MHLATTCHGYCDLATAWQAVRSYHRTLEVRGSTPLGSTTATAWEAADREVSGLPRFCARVVRHGFATDSRVATEQADAAPHAHGPQLIHLGFSGLGKAMPLGLVGKEASQFG